MLETVRQGGSTMEEVCALLSLGRPDKSVVSICLDFVN